MKLWPNISTITVKLGQPYPCKFELSTDVGSFDLRFQFKFGILNEIMKFPMSDRVAWRDRVKDIRASTT